MYIFIIMLSMLNKPITLQPNASGKIQKPCITNKGEITDTPADFWKLYWTGVGNISDWVVSNTIQGGLFTRPNSDSIGNFDASDAQHNRMQQLFNNASSRGKTAEYPAGSKQYYCYEAGLWVGALRRFPGDSVWTRVMSRGAYSSDIGAMSIPELDSTGEAGNLSGKGLAFSTQKIPAGCAHPGEFLFTQLGNTPKPYQALWPFADTLLNQKRASDDQLVPANGDIVSNEDTYAVGGDWIPDSIARTIWVRDSGHYDGAKGAMGIRIEQRTYSWKNVNFLLLNYKIRNMTNDTLKNAYFGYFMDNDVGCDFSDTAQQGCKDDMIGYDKTLNLGYSYDSDGYEPGWTTTAGYIGCVLCETPGNIGFTGFNSWEWTGADSLVDLPLQDSLKYNKMVDTAFCSISTPSDVKQLSSSGPYPILLPNEEVDFTIAVVCAYNLSNLKESAQDAITRFNNGYFVGVEEENGKVTSYNYELKQNYPNPVVKTTEFQYTIPKASKVRLEIYNIAGEKVATVVNGYETAGCKKTNWNPGTIKSGIYFYKLITPDYTATRKLILMK
ncbi:MAG: T9SS type A sorting domain-containing protein [bacterium]|nr:T9SS type A sorting domain-containing protein [bacterium]